jgi:hypothetical protein
MSKNIATSTGIDTPQTELVVINKSLANQSKLIAFWLLDEQSKLYCQWILQPKNLNK